MGKKSYTYRSRGFRLRLLALMLVLAAAFTAPVHFRAEAAAQLGEEGTEEPSVGTQEVSAGAEDVRTDQRYLDQPYVFTKYDIHVKVNENNTMDITETITADFREPKHGIYRTIPLKNKVKRLDGTESDNRTRVSGLQVNEEFETSREGDSLMVRIGDADLTVSGEVTYVISYNYNLGRDPLEQADEFYLNLIGTEWEAPIGGITFTIEMPKDFDKTKMGFSYGRYGTVNTEDLSFSVNGLVAKGRLDKVLNPGEALTVRCELPEGYFVGAGLSNRTLDYICYGLPVLFLIISILIWNKYGRDDLVVETVEFYPPEGVNSLEAGFLFKGRADSTDVVSLLIYLANAGYLAIEETETKKLIGTKKGFRVVEVKPYDGNDENEREFLEGLFKYGRTVDGVRTVTSGDLTDSFYTTKDKIIANTMHKTHVDKVFVRQSAWRGLALFLMIVGTFFLICFPPIYAYEDLDTLWVMAFPLVGVSIMVATIFGGRGKGRGNQVHRNIGTKIIVFFFGIIFGLIPTGAVIFPLLEEDVLYMVGFFVGLACCIGIILCFIYLPKRTPYGNEMLGRLAGFRNFLEVAEKERLEQLVMQDPLYFFNILPYTYVLGVSDKWIKKFETIALDPPSWYRASYYDPYCFGHFMDDTMTTATRSMTSSPSESSGGGGGGGFSGGGFSGGGSGGGGGGAW